MYNALTDQFTNPVKIVDDGAKNLNPAVQMFWDGSGRKIIVYYQTNKNGNWDIAYSIFDGAVWSTPQLYAATPADETNPTTLKNQFVNSRYNFLYKQGNDIRCVREITNQPVDVIVFSDDTENRYSDAAGFFSYPNYAIISVKKTKPTREIIWVYKEIESAVGPEITIQSPFPISKAEFAVNFPSSFSSVVLLCNVNRMGRKEIFYADRFNLQDSSMFYQLQTDTAMDAYDYTYYFIPIVVKPNERMPFVYGPSCVYYRNNEKLLLSTTYHDPDNWPMDADTLVPVSYLASHSVVGTMGYNQNIYKYVSYVIWEDSASGHVQLFGVPRYDAVGAVTPENGKSGFRLFNNYPNPFNPSTHIAFELQETSHARVEVFNSRGQSIAVLLDGVVTAGTHEVNFTPNGLAAGVYFARLATNNFSKTIHMVYLK
ncbi:MAG: T9SS type A sorting domain-containing protein [Ignavibacteriales bacterium]|nr:T9SS type A sorting domain-containing protein [Ignavibacteriales bacterium]